VAGDVVLRRTPYELVFGPARFEAEVFPAIRAEAESRGAGGMGPDSFVLLGTVGRLLRELRPAGGGFEPADQPPAEAMQQYGSLAWHAWGFWQAGRPVYALADDLTRGLLAEAAPIGPWLFRPPVPAGYLQLSRHRLWARVTADAAAEPVDGFHWTWLAADASAGRGQPRLDLLLALGMRPGRGGLSVIEIATSPPAGPAGHWGDLQARPDGPDFANLLPGGELQGYHGIVYAAEALKLVSRCFHWIETRPETVSQVAGASEPAAPDPEAMTSRLTFRAVRLSEARRP
jgi:hypothetical protein